MTATSRNTMAISERRCLACANYRAPFQHFSSTCRVGGLDPYLTAAATSPDAAIARATVRWDNSCPRFVLAERVAA